ncbi:MAG TPA: AMP-binding protein [Ktedonobacterales bacterium]|nr:AMP-binding protein [Ktedonobacterales bacterium]
MTSPHLSGSFVPPVAGNSASPDIAWRPGPAYLERSRLLRFMRAQGISDYQELMRRSIEDPTWFWDAVSKDLELEWYRPYEQVMDASRGVAWTTWWKGGRFNYVHNALDKHAASDRRDQPAVIWEGETGETQTLTYAQLAAETNRLANALHDIGIGVGDCVGVFMPMIPAVVIATLACSKIGAIYTPIFSGYAAGAVASRLEGCAAKLLITANGFHRRGAHIDMKAVADEAAAACPSVEHVLVHRHTDHQPTAWHEGKDLWWQDIVQGQSDECNTEPMDPEDPYMIIYTSGTTGKPKGTVHVHGGFPIKGAQDMAHCFDAQAGDRFGWMTDIGWMMGPWVISSALMLGGTVFLYDGAPNYPRPDRIWEMVERHRITHLGISPTLIRSLMPAGDDLPGKHDLSSLFLLGSSGEPWTPEAWHWLFEHVCKRQRPIINYSGGTEISGGIVSCTTIQPLKPCAFSGAIAGVAADVVDEQGQPVRGRVGELIIRAANPGMTRGFWGDQQRYLDTYWSRLPDIWVHGDWAEIDEDGFWYIRGRSDDTIKVAGKRLGPAEAEAAACAHPAVAQAAAIGLPHDIKGEELVLLVILRPEFTPGEALSAEIANRVAHELGKALRPTEIYFVADLPRTRSGKIMRRTIRAILQAKDPGDLSSLENPAALEEIGRLH